MAENIDGKLIASFGYNILNETFKFYTREGDTVPENGSCPVGGKSVEMSPRDVFSKKRVLIAHVPGAFTPTCTSSQVPDWEAAYDELKEKCEVDEIYITSVNDPFVMNAWFEEMGIKKLKALPDGNASFASRLYLNGVMKEAGMGIRSRRAATLWQNGQLIDRWVEPLASEENLDPYQNSTPKNILATV